MAEELSLIAMGFRLVLLKLVNANRRTVSIVVINSKETNEKVRKKNLFD